MARAGRLPGKAPRFAEGAAARRGGPLGPARPLRPRRPAKVFTDREWESGSGSRAEPAAGGRPQELRVLSVRPGIPYSPRQSSSFRVL